MSAASPLSTRIGWKFEFWDIESDGFGDSTRVANGPSFVYQATHVSTPKVATVIRPSLTGMPNLVGSRTVARPTEFRTVVWSFPTALSPGEVSPRLLESKPEPAAIPAEELKALKAPVRACDIKLNVSKNGSDSVIVSSSAIISPTLAYRSPTFFAQHFLNNASNALGTLGSRWWIGRGSLFLIWSLSSFSVDPEKGVFPDRSSYKMTPRAQMSERPSSHSTRPANCSGDMYSGVPATSRPFLFCSSSSRMASPKSATYTRPSGSTSKFSGFRSRWTIPAAWAALTAKQT